MANITVPNGCIVLKTTIDVSKGKVREEIIRGGKSSCSAESESWFRELMEAEIPGYDNPEQIDGGKTQEAYEQKRVKVRMPAKQQEEDEIKTTPNAPSRQGYSI